MVSILGGDVRRVFRSEKEPFIVRGLGGVRDRAKNESSKKTRER